MAGVGRVADQLKRSSAVRLALAIGAAGSMAVVGAAVPASAGPAVPAPACETPPQPQTPPSVPPSIVPKPKPDPSEPPEEPPVSVQPPSARLPVGERPTGPQDPCADRTHHNPDDPRSNPNLRPKPLPGMDPATATAVCKPEKGFCTVSPPPGPDSRFRIDAEGGTQRAVLFGTMNGNWRPASVEASGKPNCPDYTERNSDWVQFGFFEQKRGASWHKTAVMTQRQRMEEGAATALAEKIQVCFAAPYAFPTREGYRLGRSGPDRAGVLADCHSVGKSAPCLAMREIAKVRGGWVVRLTFKVPANDRDPKALG